MIPLISPPLHILASNKSPHVTEYSRSHRFAGVAVFCWLTRAALEWVSLEDYLLSPSPWDSPVSEVITGLTAERIATCQYRAACRAGAELAGIIAGRMVEGQNVFELTQDEATQPMLRDACRALALVTFNMPVTTHAPATACKRWIDTQHALALHLITENSWRVTELAVYLQATGTLRGADVTAFLDATISEGV